jgi:hypothetical protein
MVVIATAVVVHRGIPFPYVGRGCGQEAKDRKAVLRTWRVRLALALLAVRFRVITSLLQSGVNQLSNFSLYGRFDQAFIRAKGTR